MLTPPSVAAGDGPVAPPCRSTEKLSSQIGLVEIEMLANLVGPPCSASVKLTKGTVLNRREPVK